MFNFIASTQRRAAFSEAKFCLHGSAYPQSVRALKQVKEKFCFDFSMRPGGCSDCLFIFFIAYKKKLEYKNTKFNSKK